MGDPGFISGFIGVGIDTAINKIVKNINIALRCKKELTALNDVVMSIDPIISHIQQYRHGLNMKKGISASHSHNNASAVNVWLKKLEALLLQASQMVQQCAIPRFNIFSRHQTSTRITNLISEIDRHLKLVPLIHWAETEELHLRIGQYMQRESVQASTSAASTSGLQSIAPTAGGFFIEEPLIVGQEEALARLENFVVDVEGEGNSLFRIGVVGKGGAGKTLLLKRVFNSQKVRDLFRDDLLLWLTVSNDPSFTHFRTELCMQIAMLTKTDLDRNMGDECAKIWLNQRLQTHRFAIFLDDVWRDGSKLMEELGLLRLIHRSNSKVIVTSRDRRVLSEIGVAETSTIRMGDLVEEDSWQLFANHAFPYNKGNPPANIDEKTAKVVCANCGGLPLAIKAIGRAMAGTTHPQEWEVATQRLPIADNHEQESSRMYDRLRLSYDALGNYSVNLQLCFLYAAVAFPEDEIIHVENMVVPLWMGEGLLARKKNAVYNPLEMGRIYVDLLADRCLIEPAMREIDGHVFCFRIHDVFRTLGIQIAEREESFYCRVGTGLTALPANECLGRTRILLTGNQMSSLPESLRGPAIWSWLMDRNKHFTKIPKRLIGSMISLRVLDLSGTSLSSLPNSVEGLKQLVCLKLRRVPIRILPSSLVNLVNLEFLELDESSIMELPRNLHKLRSLKYLYLRRCTDLQYLPRNISRLTSLQCLDTFRCSRLWTKLEPKNRLKEAASIHDLGSLIHLKKLVLENNGETLQEGTLGKMAQMESLILTLGSMTSLPQDMVKMAKLKMLKLQCSHLIKMEMNSFEFRNLSGLRFYKCLMLEELPDLHKLGSLKELEIIKCHNIKKFPKGFGERGAFPLLETFSLVSLDELEELPLIHEGAMPSLKIFIMMQCTALKMLPESYLIIKNLKKIKVLGCPMVLENLQKVKIENKQIEMVTMSTTKTIESVKRYGQVKDTIDSWSYDEFSYNEVFRVMYYIDRTL